MLPPDRRTNGGSLDVHADDGAARGARRSAAQGLWHRRCGGRGAARRLDRDRGGRVDGDHGSVGVGQVHAPALPGRARPADAGKGLHRRRRSHDAQRQTADPAAARQGRVRLPGVQPDPDADRGREHHAAAGHRGHDGDRAWFDTVVDTVGLRDRLDAPALRALGRPAATGRRRRGPSSSRPEIVFADEPTGNLDSTQRRGVADVPANGRRRPRSDDRDGDARCARRRTRGPHRVPGRRPHRGRAAANRPPTRSWTG